MAELQSYTAVLIDEVTLSVDELAHACDVEPDWVLHHVEAGVLCEGARDQLAPLRFRSSDLRRARELLRLERDFDANEDVAALVIDLADEVQRLRARMQVLGVR
jgi:chaperone modulatory protein CbpM